MEQNQLSQKSIQFNSIGIKIIIGVSLIGVMALLFIWVITWRLNTITEHNASLASVYQPVKIYAYASLQGVNQVVASLHSEVYTADVNVPAGIGQEIIKKWQSNAWAHYDSLRQVITQSRTEPELLVNFEAISDRMEKMDQLLKKAANLNKPGKRRYLYFTDRGGQEIDTSGVIRSNRSVTAYNEELAFIVSNDITRLQNELQQYYQQLIDFNEKTIQEAYSRLAAESSSFGLLEVLLIGLMVIAMIITIWVLLKAILKDIAKIKLHARALSEGGLPMPVSIANQEFKQIGKYLNTLAQQLERIRKFALSVSDGNFSAELQAFDGKGEFGGAIVQMRSGLLKVSTEDEIRSWKNEGLAKFSDILRKEANNLEDLSDELIGELVKYIGANQGGLFIVNDTHTNQAPFLEMVSAYAYNKKKYLEKRIEKGQGLVGRAWLEGLPIYLKEIPENYLEIRTGMGGASPRYLLVVPLKTADEVQGILEIASFKDFLPYQREFIEQIAASIASTYSSTKINRRTRLLLVESQQIATQMREQEEELRQNVEELQATQEEMQRTQREISEKEGNMRALLDNTSDAIMAFDHAYRILVINKVMRRLYESVGVYLEVNRTIEDPLPGRSWEEMKEEFSRALSGERFVGYSEVSIKGQPHYYEILYNPIYNERQRVIGASVFITDVTQQRAAEMSLKMNEANLKSLIQNTEDSIMAFDKDYKILVFNEVFKKRRKELDFEVGDSVFQTMPEELREEWKKYYDRALKGERFQKVVKRNVGNNKTNYREYSFNPIVNEASEIIGASVFSKDITEAKMAEAENQRIMAGLYEKQRLDNQKIKELERLLSDYKKDVIQ